MIVQKELFGRWLGGLSASLMRDWPAVCGIYAEETEYSAAVIVDGKLAAVRRFSKEAAAGELAQFLSSLGISQSDVVGAVMLPESVLLDSYQEPLGILREKELPGAVEWSLMTRETIMERQVWWAAAPVDEVSGTYSIGAIPREDGLAAAALLRFLGIEPLAVFVSEKASFSGTAGYGEQSYRIAVPVLGEGLADDKPMTMEPAERAAYLLWTAMGRSLPERIAGGRIEASAPAMNYLPVAERPEKYRWKQLTALMLSVWLLALGGMFLQGKREIAAARRSLENEEQRLAQIDKGGEERHRMMAAEKRAAAILSEAVQLSKERQPVSPTLEALGVLTPTGIYLTEITSRQPGLVEIKGQATRREQIDSFMEQYRRRMNPGMMKLSRFSEAKHGSGSRAFEREFVITLGEEKKL